MTAWLYITSCVIEHIESGARLIHFEHCVVMARDVESACRQGWRDANRPR